MDERRKTRAPINLINEETQAPFFSNGGSNFIIRFADRGAAAHRYSKNGCVPVKMKF